MKTQSKNEENLEKKLTQAQKNFVHGYLEHGNGTRAAKEAGYSEKSASAQSSVLLRNPKVIAYMDEVRSQIESSKIAKIDEVMEYFTRVMRGEETDQFGLDVSITDRNAAGKELMKRLANIDNGNITPVVIINDIPRPEKKKEGDNATEDGS